MKRWSVSEVEQLKSLINTELTYAEIGEILGRSEVAIQKKSTKLGLTGFRVHRPRTDSWNNKISESKKGSIPWNKGKKGSVPWNKGKKYPAITGNKNPKWNGGVKKRNDGYTYVLAKQHPFASKDGYIMEHRLVMEKHIGRYLKASEVVHHINGIRNDNRVENLQIFSDVGSHTSYHFKQRREMLA